jgi:hypothetical protein
MSSRIIIPFNMRKVTGEREFVEVKGNTIRECMEDLFRQYPETREWFNPENAIVWMVLNQNIINFDQMDMVVPEGTDIDLILVIGGG